jgi:hypothetical protein
MALILRFLVPFLSSLLVFAQATVVTPGTILEPKTMPASAALRAKLPHAVDVEESVTLPNSDELLVYDSVHDSDGTTDFMDNHPHVALWGSGGVLFDSDVASLASSGPTRFQGMAVLPGGKADAVAVLAFSLGVDGAGTFFVFIGQPSARYEVVATLTGTQAQLRFRLDGRYEMWSADGASTSESCVWCPKYFKKTTLTWRDGTLRRVATTKTSRGYQPDTFADKPFVLVK